MKFPLGEMTVGDILDRGIRLLFARLPAYYTINLLVLSPVIVLQLVLPFILPEIVGQGANQLDPSAAIAVVVVFLIVVILTLIFQQFAAAAILHIVMEEYAGRKVGFGGALSYALSRFAPLLGASIVVGLLVGIGFLLCCIPGIYMGVIFAFVSQVVVLERMGVGEALTRSSTLVSGYWWRVFGVLFLIYLANWIVQWSFGKAMEFVLPFAEVIPGPNGPQIKFNGFNYVVAALSGALLSILFTTYIAVCVTLLYLDLRIRKEGLDLELASGGDGGVSPRRSRRDDDYDDDGYDDDRPRRRRRDDDDDEYYDDDRGRR